MNCVISTILIPLLLVSQSLCAVPHSHAGGSIAEPVGHAVRPHVHLHGADHHHGHHENGDETPSSTGEQGPDHDSDAVYTGDDQLLHDGRVTKVAGDVLTGLYVVCDKSEASIAMCRQCMQFSSPSRMLRPKSALYVQLRSIRC